MRRGLAPSRPLRYVVHTMTQQEYEQSKQRLAEQRRAGVELVERAYEAQMRALELVWMLQGGAGPAALPAADVSPGPPVLPERPRRRSGPEVEADVLKAFPRLPDVFTRREVCGVLGYEPDRGALYRALKKLVEDGLTRVEFAGDGQRPARYRKTAPEHSPAAS
jgi:hypothetical protein